MTFDDYYADVPTEQREALQDFRVQHPAKQVTIDNTEWSYITAGEGEHPFC